MPSLTYLGQSWSHSNKLQSAIFKFLKTQNRVHLEDYQVTAFQELILLQIAQLNKEYSRCKPVRSTWENSHNSMDSVLSTDGQQICDFRIYTSESLFID